MKKKLLIKSFIIISTVCILLLILWSLFEPHRGDKLSDTIDKYIKVDKLSDKVIVVKMGYDAVAAIATQKGIMVIDAGISNSLTIKYREIIEKEFKRNNFAYLINTHSHWDHIGGNQVFPEAVIVGQENCLNEISVYWKDREKIKAGLKEVVDQYENQLKDFDSEWQDSLEIYLQKIRYQYAYNDLLNDRVITLPAVTFKDTMSISMGDVNFNMIYFGKAHSGSDILIHIPEEKVLIVGDLFMEYGRPSIAETSKINSERWMIVKKWIESRLNNIEKVLGGHGQIMGKEDLLSFIENIEKKERE